MFRSVILGIVVSGAVAGAALAQSADGDYQNLSVGNKRIVDALYTSQQPIAGAPHLTREDIVSLRSDGGWGVAFKDLKDGGYYPDAKNLGQVVSSARRRDAVARSPTSDTTAGGADRAVRSNQIHRRDAATKRTTRRTAARAKHRQAHRSTARHAVRHNRATRVQRIGRSSGRGKVK